MTTDTSGEIRLRILDAGLGVLRTEGIRRLTQVRVAKRAGVRQSHLTYYFPTRQDLLEGITIRFADHLAEVLGQAVGGFAAGESGPMLARLTGLVTELDHMRGFIGMIVEADRDPALRSIVTLGTERIVSSLAQLLGGENAADRATVVLATLWGLGLYRFAVRPTPDSDPTRVTLAWLGSPGVLSALARSA